MREVIVWPTVDNALWSILDETHYNDLRDRLFSTLERMYDRWRVGGRLERHPDDEALFVLVLYSIESNRRHKFLFHIDDTMADTSLFVLGVIHSSEAIG